MNRIFKCFSVIPVILIIQSCNKGFDLYEGTGEGGKVILYVSEIGSDSNPGTRKKPMRNIHTAVNYIYRYFNTGEVHVAQGNYPVSYQAGTHIVVRDHIPLYGGYSADFSVRDASLYKSIITETSTAGGSQTDPNRAVYVGDDVSNTTVMDGFTINGGGGEYNYAVYMKIGTITLSNCEVNGGNATNTSMGVFVTSGISGTGTSSTKPKPVITNNIINGGSGGQYSIGIYLTSTIGEITNNSINGGSSTNIAVGILAENNCIANIKENTIIGSSQIVKESYGMINRIDCQTSITYNIIDGGIAFNKTVGIYCQEISGLALYNNTIFGGDSQGDSIGIDNENSAYNIYYNIICGGTAVNNTYGIRLSGNIFASLRYNFIHGGNPKSAHDNNSSYSIYAYNNAGYYISGNIIYSGIGGVHNRGLAINIIGEFNVFNNLIFTNNNTYSSCMYEIIEPHPMEFTNNILHCQKLYDQSDKPIIFSTSGGDADGINKLHDLTNISEYNYGVINWNLDYSTDNPANYFINFNSVINTVTELLNNDFHLKTDESVPCSVTQGGINHEALGPYPYSGPCSP